MVVECTRRGHWVVEEQHSGEGSWQGCRFVRMAGCSEDPRVAVASTVVLRGVGEVRIAHLRAV